MIKILLLFIPPFLLVESSIIAQNLDKIEKHKVEEIYKKIELENGILDEDGRDIDYLYKPHELENGKYKVEIEDGDGDFYHIKDTQLYIKFTRYFGYAGYGKEGILKVDYYDTYFYKMPD